jgi:hypothetical protein
MAGARAFNLLAELSFWRRLPWPAGAATGIGQSESRTDDVRWLARNRRANVSGKYRSARKIALRLNGHDARRL